MDDEPRAGRDRGRVHALRDRQHLGRVAHREVDHDVTAREGGAERHRIGRVADAMWHTEVRGPRETAMGAHDRHDVAPAIVDRQLEQTRADESAGADDGYAAHVRRLQCRASAASRSDGVSHSFSSGSARE